MKYINLKAINFNIIIICIQKWHNNSIQPLQSIPYTCFLFIFKLLTKEFLCYNINVPTLLGPCIIWSDFRAQKPRLKTMYKTVISS